MFGALIIIVGVPNFYNLQLTIVLLFQISLRYSVYYVLQCLLFPAHFFPFLLLGLLFPNTPFLADVFILFCLTIM